MRCYTRNILLYALIIALIDLGRLVLNLVREFLAFLKLECTLSVFEAEAIEGRSLQVIIQQLFIFR